MNTDIDNYILHKEFQETYKLEHPERECRVQNLLGTYTTLHADNAFICHCKTKDSEYGLKNKV